MFRTIPLVGGLVAVFMATAAAQTAVEEGAVPPPEETLITTQKERQMLSSDLLGTAVLNPQGEQVGRLESLLFDEDQKIVGGIVSVGGFLGIGAKSVALSWDAFEVRQDEQVILLDLAREQLEAAPTFKDLAQIEAEAEAERARQQMQEPTPQPTQPQPQ